MRLVKNPKLSVSWMYILENSSEIQVNGEEESCVPSILYSVIINVQRSENLLLVIAELKSFLLWWKYSDFWVKGEALLFCSDYDSNLPEMHPSLHPLCMWTLCELCGLWWSSAPHLCLCEKDVLLVRWRVSRDSICSSMHNNSRIVLCKPLYLHVLKGLLSLCTEPPAEECF